MNDYKQISELLQTDIGTEGSLLIPRKILGKLVEEVDKNLIPRSEAAMFFGPAQIPGASLDINLVDVNTMDVRIVGEGAEIPLDQEKYSNINLKPIKYGVAIRITKEMEEDSMFPLLAHGLATAGKRFAENENSLVIAALDTAGTTVGGGAAVTIANITAAIFGVENNDYTPTTMIVGNDVAQDIRNIDTFAEADKFGSNEMMSTGFIGRVYGLPVLRVSSNAGATSTTAYIFDNRHAYVIAEKRPITVENFNLPTYDMRGAVVTQRIIVRQLRSNAIATITSS